jgi:chromosome segregation ATPase
VKDTDIIAAIAPDAVSLMDKAIAEIKRLRQENATLTDEIERLRAGGCARDQKTTQFCAEAVTLQREVEMLREMVAEMRERNNKLLHRLQEYEAREAE